MISLALALEPSRLEPPAWTSARAKSRLEIVAPASPVQVLAGDCLEVLKTLADNSIDAVVTDPPYGIRFMGKAWDGKNIDDRAAKHIIADGENRTGRAATAGEYDLTPRGMKAFQRFTFEYVSECLRVLKPGGHLVSFSSTRTYHRMACAIEDAGFEIRDQLAWTYGQGFPKSHDVSKGIDKRGGVNVNWFGPWLRKWRTNKGISSNQVGTLFPSKTGGATGCVRNWELGLGLPTVEQFNLICSTFNLPFDSMEEAEREVVRHHIQSVQERKSGFAGEDKPFGSWQYDITAPATEAARQWEGWGTALKPSYEPICLAQKPLNPQQLLSILVPTIGKLICALLEKTATSPSGADQTTGFWSIASSLNNCLADLWGNESKFTTETASALTTDLKILKSLLLRITQGITTEEASQTNGGASNVSLAETISRSVLAKCERLRFTTAGEIAIDWLAQEGTGPEGKRLSPNWEPICLARKPLSEKTVAANVLRWGTGALNVDGCRIATGDVGARAGGRRPTTHEGYQRPNATMFQDKSEWSLSALGRFPANLCHDGSQEVLDLFPRETVGGGKENGGNRPGGFGDVGADSGSNRPCGPTYLDKSSAARFMYCAKASKSDRAGSKHPTVKPVKLMQWLCRMVCPSGGIVLDPFAGSGTTGAAAILEGFRAILIEREDEYVADIRRRLSSMK